MQVNYWHPSYLNLQTVYGNLRLGLVGSNSNVAIVMEAVLQRITKYQPPSAPVSITKLGQHFESWEPSTWKLQGLLQKTWTKLMESGKWCVVKYTLDTISL